MRGGGRAWLAHPVTVVALVVLVLNDHVWKARYPGVVTGKLSDVAGLVLAPAVLGAVVGLVRLTDRVVLACAGVVGAGFVAVKAVPAGAVLASALWSVVVGPSTIRADVTDLVALPGLGLAVWVGLRAAASTAPTAPTTQRRRGAGGLVTLVLLPSAALAIAATTGPTYPPDAVIVQVRNGHFVVGVSTSDARSRAPDHWRVSLDGGFIWQPADRDTVDALDSSVPTRGCAPEDPAHCYRVVAGHLRVEETLDNGRSWRVCWEIADDQRHALANRYDGLVDVDEYLSSRSLAVAAVPGGHGVVVANGRDGLVVRDANGRWYRTGFGAEVTDDGSLSGGGAPPLDRSVADVAVEIAGAALLGLLVMTVAGGIALGRTGQWGSVATVASMWATGATLALFGAQSLEAEDPGLWPIGSIASPLAFAFGSVLAVVGAGLALGLGTGLGAMRWRTLARVLLVGLLTAAIPTAGFLAWVQEPVSYRRAGLTMVAVAVLGLALAVTLTLQRAHIPRRVEGGGF